MKNFFATFSLPVSFNIDLDALEQKYFSLQQQFHPDAASVAEIEQSMIVNEAYNVLKSPLKRAAHILQLNDIDVEQDGGVIRPDSATLQEVLELQEKIFECKNSAVEELENIKKYLAQEIKSLLAKTAEKLENGLFVEAAQFLIKAKYFDKMQRDLKSS